MLHISTNHIQLTDPMAPGQLLAKAVLCKLPPYEQSIDPPSSANPFSAARGGVGLLLAGNDPASRTWAWESPVLVCCFPAHSLRRHSGHPLSGACLSEKALKIPKAVCRPFSSLARSNVLPPFSPSSPSALNPFFQLSTTTTRPSRRLAVNPRRPSQLYLASFSSK